MIVKFSTMPAGLWPCCYLSYAPKWVDSALGLFAALTIRMHVSSLPGFLSTVAASEDSFITMDSRLTKLNRLIQAGLQGLDDVFPCRARRTINNTRAHDTYLPARKPPFTFHAF